MFEGEVGDVLLGPGGGFGVEGAFEIVALVTDHFADANDHVGEGLSGTPMIADADFLRVDVGMENGRQHATEGGTTRIVEGEKDFGLMDGTGQEAFVTVGNEALNVESESESFRRRAFGFDQANVRMLGKELLNLIEIGLKTAETSLHIKTNDRERR